MTLSFRNPFKDINIKELSTKFFYSLLLVLKDISFFILLGFSTMVSAFLFSSVMPETEMFKKIMFGVVAIVIEVIKAYALVKSNSLFDYSRTLKPEKEKKIERKTEVTDLKKNIIRKAKNNFAIYLGLAFLSILSSYAFSLYSVNSVGDDAAKVKIEAQYINIDNEISSIDERNALNKQSLVDMKKDVESLTSDYDKQIIEYRKQLNDVSNTTMRTSALTGNINSFISRKTTAVEDYITAKQKILDKIKIDTDKKSALLENRGKISIENVSSKDKSSNIYEILGQALFNIGTKNAMFFMLILLSLIVELGTYFTSPHPHWRDVIDEDDFLSFDDKEQRIKTVEKFIEKEVFVDRVVEVIKEVPFETIKEVIVEKEVFVDKPIEVIKEIFVDRVVEVIKEVPFETIKEVIVEKEVFVDRIVEVIKEVEKIPTEKEELVSVKAESLVEIIDPSFIPLINNEEQFIINNKGIDELTSWVKKEVRELEPLRSEKQRIGK